MEDKARTKSILLWFAIIILFILLAVGISNLFSRKKGIQPAKQTPTNGVPVVQKIDSSVAPVAGGSIKLAVSDNSDVVSIDRQTVVRAIATSGTIPVVGYDIVIVFDPSILAYVSTDHMLPGYTGNVRVSPGQLVISGVIRQDTASRSLNSDIIEAIRFQPLKTGKAMLAIVFTPGATNESNLISPQSRDILSKVTPLSLTIGRPLQINLGESKALDSSAYLLRLDHVSAPSSTCRDCIASQDLTFIDSAKHTQAAFGFRSGGFAGTMHDETRMGGYIFKMIESTEKSITVLVATE